MTLTGDPLIKGSQIETPPLAIIGAGQSADAPSPDMVLAIQDRRTFRDREIRSGRGSYVRGWLRRLRDAIDHLRHGGRQDFDVLVVAKPAATGRGRPASGRKAAHLALDHSRVMASAAPLGRHRADLDQHHSQHAVASARGKKPRAAAGGGARRGRYAEKTAHPGRHPRRGWPGPSGGAARSGSAADRTPPARQGRPDGSAASAALPATSP